MPREAQRGDTYKRGSEGNRHERGIYGDLVLLWREA